MMNKWPISSSSLSSYIHNISLFYEYDYISALSRVARASKFEPRVELSLRVQYVNIQLKKSLHQIVVVHLISSKYAKLRFYRIQFRHRMKKRLIMKVISKNIDQVKVLFHLCIVKDFQSYC